MATIDRELERQTRQRIVRESERFDHEFSTMYVGTVHLRGMMAARVKDEIERYCGESAWGRAFAMNSMTIY